MTEDSRVRTKDDVVVASAIVVQPGCRPVRIVVRNLGKEYVVHTESLTTETPTDDMMWSCRFVHHSFENGDYFLVSAEGDNRAFTLARALDCYRARVKRLMGHPSPPRRTATEVRELHEGTGDIRLYKLSEPMTWYARGNGEDVDDERRETSYVAVSATVVSMSGPETYIFPADEDGKILDMIELGGSFQGRLDHVKALRDAGYVVIEKED